MPPPQRQSEKASPDLPCNLFCLLSFQGIEAGIWATVPAHTSSSVRFAYQTLQESISSHFPLYLLKSPRLTLVLGLLTFQGLVFQTVGSWFFLRVDTAKSEGTEEIQKGRLSCPSA